MFYYVSFSRANLLHENCLLSGFKFFIKILLAKITFLFWTLPFCLLNMPSFCIGIISWCCFVAPSFYWCSPVPQFHGIPIVPPVFRCSVSVPMFRCSAGVLYCVVSCSSVLGFYSMPLYSHQSLVRNLNWLSFDFRQFQKLNQSQINFNFKLEALCDSD